MRVPDTDRQNTKYVTSVTYSKEVYYCFVSRLIMQCAVFKYSLSRVPWNEFDVMLYESKIIIIDSVIILHLIDIYYINQVHMLQFCTWMHLPTCMHAYIHADMYTRTRTCTHACMNAWTHTCMHTHPALIHTHSLPYICMYMYTYVHRHTIHAWYGFENFSHLACKVAFLVVTCPR